MNELEQLPKLLKEISPKQWEVLFEYIPLIEECSTFGSQQGGQEMADGVYMGHYTVLDEVVTSFIGKIERMGLIPVFDWMKWTEGREMIQSNETDYTKLELTTLIKLFTVMSRQDRFSDGFLVDCFERGIVTQILKAIQSNISG